MLKSCLRFVPSVGPVIQGVGVACDVKEIVEQSTPVGAAKIIIGRVTKECTPPEIFIAGKCVMVVGGVITSLGIGGDPLVVSSTVGSLRSMIKDI
jgi:hypothetical protein